MRSKDLRILPTNFTYSRSMSLTAAIEKLEIAFRLAPELTIISARLFGLYCITLLQVKEGSREHKRRAAKMAKYAKNWKGFLIV